MDNSYKIEQRGAVLTVRVFDIDADWEFWCLLRSDAHHDAVDCRRDLEQMHLEKAKKRGALIFDFGDTFDAMQGKFDPRRSLSDVRPEDASQDYYDKIVIHAAEDYKEYAENFALIAKGNHETSVLDKVNTDLISNVVFRMNSELRDEGSDHRIHVGNYGGWIRFMFTYHTTKRKTYRLKYLHGSGGNAPVTRGVIQTNRQAVYLPDADFVVNGHNHQSYIVPIKRERLSDMGRVKQDVCWFLRIPGYKDDWGDGSQGYAVEKGKGPTTQGSVWIRFYYEDRKIKAKPIMEIE